MKTFTIRYDIEVNIVINAETEEQALDDGYELLYLKRADILDECDDFNSKIVCIREIEQE